MCTSIGRGKMYFLYTFFCLFRPIRFRHVLILKYRLVRRNLAILQRNVTVRSQEIGGAYSYLAILHIITQALDKYHNLQRLQELDIYTLETRHYETPWHESRSNV